MNKNTPLRQRKYEPLVVSKADLSTCLASMQIPPIQAIFSLFDHTMYNLHKFQSLRLISMLKIFNLLQAWGVKYTSEIMENPCLSQNPVPAHTRTPDALAQAHHFSEWKRFP